MWALAQLLPAPAFWFTRYLIVVSRQLFPRPMSAAPRGYLIGVHMPLPAAPLVELYRYLIVVPRPMPASPRRYLIVLPRPISAAARTYIIVVPWLLPAAPLVGHRRYLILALSGDAAFITEGETL